MMSKPMPLFANLLGGKYPSYSPVAPALMNFSLFYVSMAHNLCHHFSQLHA